MLRAIKCATRIEAEALAAKVNAEHGYPRCDRLSGTITAPKGVVLRCPCTDARNPDPTCRFATRAEHAPIELADRSWALPVRETEARTVAALDGAERAAIVDVQAAEMKGDERASVASEAEPKG